MRRSIEAKTRIASMRDSPQARRIALNLGLVAALIGIGVAVAAVVTRGGAPRVAAPASGPMAFVSTSSSPPPIAASAALHRVLTSLNGGGGDPSRERSDLVSARIGTSSPRGTPPSRKAAVPAFYVTAKIPGFRNGASIESLWEADLLEGAVVELAGSSPSLQSDVGYVDFSGQLPGGKVIPNIGGGMGDVARGQHFEGSTETDTAIRRSVEQGASEFGLTVDSVKIFRALGAAPAVVLTAPRISAVASKYQSLVSALFGVRPRYEGYYLELRTVDGRPFVRRSVSFLTGAGRLWIAGLVHGGGALPAP